MNMRRPHGFTLLELLVVIAILAVAFGMGVPAMRALLAPASTEAYVSTYLQALHTTRHLAVDGRRGVTLCALDATRRCNGRWAQRLTLFFDDARRGELLDPDDMIAEVQVAASEPVSVTWRGFGERRFLHVRANGSYRQNGRFLFCPATGSAASGRQLVVNVTGRVRVERTICR